MKKLKMFVIAGGLLLVTVSVVAGRSKFLTAVYAINASNVFVPLTLTVPSSSIITTIPNGADLPITTTDHNDIKYGFYELVGGNYLPFYVSLNF